MVPLPADMANDEECALVSKNIYRGLPLSGFNGFSKDL